MIRYVLILSLLLSACVKKTDETQPKVYTKAENTIQQGIKAYKEDNYLTAVQNFQQALELYQSTDNQYGMQLSRLNLITSLLGFSDFEQAKKHLDILETQQNKDLLNENLKRKLLLMQVRWHFLQQDYQNAWQSLQPLLKDLDSSQKEDKSLSLLATAARIEVLKNESLESKWLNKFQQALKNRQQAMPQYQALLQRNLATLAFKEQDYKKSTELMQQAVDYYKQQGKRRAISACLEFLGDIANAQQNLEQAKDYYQKALNIRLWLKDAYKSKNLQQKIDKITVKTK